MWLYDYYFCDMCLWAVNIEIHNYFNGWMMKYTYAHRASMRKQTCVCKTYLFLFYWLLYILVFVSSLLKWNLNLHAFLHAYFLWIMLACIPKYQYRTGISHFYLKSISIGSVSEKWYQCFSRAYTQQHC